MARLESFTLADSWLCFRCGAAAPGDSHGGVFVLRSCSPFWMANFMKKNDMPGLTNLDISDIIDGELNLDSRVRGMPSKHANDYDFADLRKLAIGNNDRNQPIKDKLVQVWRESKCGSHRRKIVLKIIQNFENRFIYNLTWEQKRALSESESAFKNRLKRELGLM